MEQSDGEYFSCYESLDVHKLMLEDEPRVISYRDAISTNQLYFRDKVVMDVGCGTGILSIFCAQAGAKKVYAVEASDVARLAKDVVTENGWNHIIEVIQSRVEDLLLPFSTKVDVIVSEWMGFFLLHEGMLDSILIARDKFLKPDGRLFPETATIYVAPCSVPSLHEKWNNVFGVSMKSFSKQLLESKTTKPEVMAVNGEDLLTEPLFYHQVNLKTDDINKSWSVSKQFLVPISKTGLYQGIAIWFECQFPNTTGTFGHSPITLNTGPFAPLTHWKQTVVVLPQDRFLEQNTYIAFQLDMKKNDVNFRRYTLELTLLGTEDVEHPNPCDCDRIECLITKASYLYQENLMGSVELGDGEMKDA